MTIKPINVLLIIGLIIGLTSCGTSYYYPTSQNVLRFKEKGDAYIAYGIDEGYKGVNLGYSITDNIAVITDYKEFKGDVSPTFLWDNELVIYKKEHKHFYPAVNLGYSYGGVNSRSWGDDGSGGAKVVRQLKLGIHRQFIQPSLGFSNKFFDIALSSRISRVHYNVEKVKDINSKYYTFEEIFNLQDVGKKDFYFFEPAITIGAGYDFLKVRFQYVFVNKLSSGNIYYYENSPNLSLKLSFNINKMFKKRAK